MRKLLLPGLSLCLSITACQDNDGQERQVVARCETLLAAQELAGLPAALRGDPRAPIRPKGDPRINDSATSIFVRRAYDRLVAGKPDSRIEPRDYTCTFSKRTGRIDSLMTNGHTQEFRLNEDEFDLLRNRS